MRGICAGAAAALLLSIATSTTIHAATFDGIGQVPGASAPWTEPTTVSGDGSAIYGIYKNGTNWDTFRWTRSGGNVGLNIPQLAANSHFHAGSSSDGSVLAGSYMGSGGDHAYRLPAGGSKQILTPLKAGGSADARGVSADGNVIVGRSEAMVGSNSHFDMAYRWTAQTGMVALGFRPGGSRSDANGVSADGSIIVGDANDGSGTTLAFRWTQANGYQTLGDLAGGQVSSGALRISDDNTTIVGTSSSAGGNEAFRWTQSTGMVGLGDLPGGDFRSYPHGVSADGSVIVGYGGTTDGNGNNVSRAIIWDQVNGMRRLDEVLTGMGVDLTGWILSSARGISADGNTIVGFGSHNGQAEGWIAVIPEPGGAALLLLSLPYTLRRRRCRR